jgi:hypothetical protein
MLGRVRPAALFAPASWEVVLTDAQPTALFVLASSAVVLANARPTALLHTEGLRV